MTAKEYIEKYGEAAMETMARTGIPASITLAQGIVESGAGTSRLCREGNNHFGIKSTPQWESKGGRFLLGNDDKPNEHFRAYETVEDCFDDHASLLMGPRYSKCRAQGNDNYKGWAHELQLAGYATASNYADTLVSVIEKNGLQKYDAECIRRQRVQNTPLLPADFAQNNATPLQAATSEVRSSLLATRDNWLVTLLGLDETSFMQDLDRLLGNKPLSPSKQNFALLVPGSKAVYLEESNSGMALTYDLGAGPISKLLQDSELHRMREILTDARLTHEDKGALLGKELANTIFSHQASMAYERNAIDLTDNNSLKL